MSYFGSSSPKEEILETCKCLQEREGYSAGKIVLALSKVLNYYAEYEIVEMPDVAG